MKKSTSKRMQKVTAILLTAVMMLSVFAVLPTDLFKASAAKVSFDDRLDLIFNNNWKFIYSDDANFSKKSYNDDGWETIELPHDFSIIQKYTGNGTESESGFLPGGTGWYRKTFVLPMECNSKSVILNFDGAYQHTSVYVNGTLVGENHYGYNSFSVDITNYIVCDGETPNVVAVRVNNTLSSSRWYSGSGIYRDVTMTIVDPVHVDLYGTYVTTPNLESSNGTDGTVNAEVTIKNDSVAKNVTVKAQILDASGAEVGTAASTQVTVSQNATADVTLNPTLANPNLWNSWDLGDPYLYTLRTTISENGTVIDTYDTEFGYRWFKWDEENGFFLNGNAVKLKGVCMHHDQGGLGAVQTYDSIYRQIKILMDMGCNSIRTTHGTPSTLFMEICNELGIIIMEEFFDGWDATKNGNTHDFSTEYFTKTIGANNNLLGAEEDLQWYEFVVKQSVKRDRNSPAVVIWDVGNELGQYVGVYGGNSSTSNFETIAKTLRNMLDDLDSARPIIQGINKNNSTVASLYTNTSNWTYKVEQYMTATGANYYPSDWANAKSSLESLKDAITGETGNPFVVTESASAISSRGVYNILKQDQSTYTCPAYDTDSVSWGTTAAGSWYPTIVNDWFAGSYTWTGFDYLGEPAPWIDYNGNNYYSDSGRVPVSSYFGIVDTAGFEKDTYYLYRSWWNEESTTLHLVPGTWDSSQLAKNGNYAYVAVYSNADHIELLGDGNVIARAQSTTTTTDAGHKYQTWTETAVASNANTTEFYTGTGKDLYPQFQVNYSAYDEISVKAYDSDGTEITDTVGTKSVSAVEATKVVATTWKDVTETYPADGNSYIYVELEAQGENGEFANNYNGKITAEVKSEGAAIVAVDNGDSATKDKFQQPSVLKSDTLAEIQMYNGKALVILRTDDKNPESVLARALADEEVELVFTAEDIPVEDGVTITTVADDETDEFEEVIDQSNMRTEPTMYEEIQQMTDDLLGEGGSAGGTVNYELYSATPDGEVVYDDEVVLPDGEYVITGAGGTVMTHGLQATGTATETSDTWFFEKQSSGKYYVYYKDSNGTNQYLNINGSNPSVATTAQQLDVRATLDGVVTIGDGNGNYISYSGNAVGTNTAATNLNLYKVARTEAGTNTTKDVVQLNAVTEITSGEEYVIVNTNNSGVMNYDLTFSGAVSTDSPTWTFVASGDGYKIKFNDNGTDRYLYLSDPSGAPVLASESEAKAFTVSFDSDGVTFSHLVAYTSGCDTSDTTFYIQKDQSTTAVSGTRDSNRRYHRIYKIVETTTTTEASVTVTPFIPTPSGSTNASPVEDGGYVIYNSNYILSATTTSASSWGTTYNGVTRVSATPSNNIITADRANEYKFTRASAYNKYYIQNQSGQYMSIGTSNGSFTFTNTPTEVTVYGRTDGTVVIHNGTQLIDNNSSGLFSTYSRAVASAATNNILTLYKNPSSANIAIPEGKGELYKALVDGLGYNPGTFTATSYQALFNALKEGYTIFKDDSETNSATISNAVQNIRTAISNLEKDFKEFPATIYKYGYTPSATGTSKYSSGGAAFNAQTYASMEEIIRADENLMSQIKEAIGYDDETVGWTGGQADTALNTAIATYAKIYSLSFTGYVTAGGTELTDHQNTSWNVWTKTDTQGANDSRDEGASIQGLFSALLNDGQPTDHAPYSELRYQNVADFYSNYFDTSAGISISVTVGSTSTSITLPPLKGVSVHINNLFEKENVLATGSTTNYSKYYWDLEFPFVASTNEYGINTYTYSSSSSDYVFQAEFDDATNTADATLTEVNGWSITKGGTTQDGAKSTGFFPFNYQKGASTFTGENAIYHYGMNFSTDFYIPVTGTYSDGEDIVFKFSGDDDVLVYVDDVLVLDNGGLHGARAASINFTDASVSYQFAMNVDAENGLVESTTENDVIYTYGDTTGLTGDELAALEKLNEVRTDGEYHTFSFYYLERGSTDSNCEISFNMQQASEYILLNDETLVVDYGIPVEYDIRENDDVDETVENLTYEYKGIVDGNTEVPSVVLFAEPNNLVNTFESKTDVLNVQGLRFGTATMRGDGLVTYNPNTMQMTSRDYFYTCAEIKGDPTYASDTVYYQYERAVFIPATTIYYEDNFGDNLGESGVNIIDFNSGTTTNGSNHGVWQTVGDVNAFADAKQAADLVGDGTANPYGFDPVYAGADETKDYTQYSGFSAQKVTVSAANNPKNGGTNPTVEFTFTGTGFDIISLTDSTTGTFYVDIFDENNTQVGKKMVVDTYYGYSYGQLYADANGQTTLENTGKPLYKSAENEAVTVKPTYYSADGITETPTYYDANGDFTTTETENPAYAYAYGWVTAKGEDVEGLYQIPVIKKTGLTYGTYTVVITPMYTTRFDNTGKGQFDVYIDAIRIYDPAGKDDGVESSILTDYKYDNESYPNYLTIKDMLIGADSLSTDSATKGVVFIDGIAALDNDLETLKLAGPNNEIYLAKGQAVAFEIWASEVPDEVQLGVKGVNGKPTLGITYGGNTVEQNINTATEMNYIINNLLPVGGKLEWSEVVVNGTTYYRTDTIVIQNTSDDSNILSLTNMKWTFTGVGQYGHYAQVTETPAVMSFMASNATITDAYTMMASKNNAGTNDDIDDGEVDVEIIPGDNEDTNDTNDEYQEELSFIQRIIRAITNFFKKIFGLA